MKKVKRIAAIIGIIFILSMYLISLISAIFSPAGAPGLFLASIFSTIVIPIIIYMYIMIYKWVHKNDPPKDTDDTADTIIKSNKQ